MAPDAGGITYDRSYYDILITIFGILYLFMARLNSLFVNLITLFFTTALWVLIFSRSLNVISKYLKHLSLLIVLFFIFIMYFTVLNTCSFSFLAQYLFENVAYYFNKQIGQILSSPFRKIIK